MSCPIAVYDGRRKLGEICRQPDGTWLVLGADGRVIGSYASRAEAQSAVRCADGGQP